MKSKEDASVNTLGQIPSGGLKKRKKMTLAKKLLGILETDSKERIRREAIRAHNKWKLSIPDRDKEMISFWKDYMTVLKAHQDGEDLSSFGDTEGEASALDFIKMATESNEAEKEEPDDLGYYYKKYGIGFDEKTKKFKVYDKDFNVIHTCGSEKECKKFIDEM